MLHCYWKSNDKVRSALEYYLKLMSRLTVFYTIVAENRYSLARFGTW